jgi:xanthine dehydrogenase accessory factor
MNGEDRPIIEELLAAQSRGEPFALAIIIRHQGSVPRHAGTKMLVYGDGRTRGTIGGGEMEARVVAAAREAMRDGRPRLVPYSLVDPSRGDPGVCGGSVEIYVEPHPAPHTLWVLGCGHVGRALAALGAWIGFRVVAWDDRPELATKANVPDAHTLLSGPPTELPVESIDGRAYLAVVTRNVGIDRQLLPPLLDTPAAYIGTMGSRRRWEETKRLLLADGVPAEKLARVTSPIGLELNAESPNEIAVSILAQIIMIQRGGDGRAMAVGTTDEEAAPVAR